MSGHKDSLFENALKEVYTKKEAVAAGDYVGIPYPYPRLNEYLACIEKGQAIGILGGSGTGKSRFTRFTFLYHVYKFYKETGYKVRIVFFCMEDSKELSFNFVLCRYLFDTYGIRITPQMLGSRKGELSDDILVKISEARDYFEEFESIVSFVDGEDEPKNMYAICRKIAMRLGKVYKYQTMIEGEEVEQFRYESDTHVIAIFDNMSNISSSDNSSNEQEAILEFVKKYMRLKLCNFFKWTCVLVQQMDFESERQSFTKAGESVAAKLEPSLASIGDSKRSARSLHLIFSLFNPARYELPQYPMPSKYNTENFYDITLLGNDFRSLKVLKSNFTETGMRVPLLFDGMTESFSELPKPKSYELNKIYESYREKKALKNGARDTVLINNLNL